MKLCSLLHFLFRFALPQTSRPAIFFLTTFSSFLSQVFQPQTRTIRAYRERGVPVKTSYLWNMLRQALRVTNAVQGLVRARVGALTTSRPLTAPSFILPRKVGSRATATPRARLVCSAAGGDMGHMEPQEAQALLQTSGWKYVDCR